MIPIFNPSTSVSFCGRLFVRKARGEVAAPRGGCRKGRALWECVELMFNNLLDEDVLRLPRHSLSPSGPGLCC